MRVHGVLCLVAVVVLAAGCRSLEPTAFADFHHSLTILQADVDLATVDALEGEREILQAQLLAGEVTPDRVSLQLEDHGYGWRLLPEPLAADRPPLPPYYDWCLARSRLQMANQAMRGYAELLLGLAKATPLSKTEKDELREHLNTLVVSGLDATPHAGTQKETTAQAGILSTVAADSFLTYLHCRRMATLRQAIRANDPVFRDYARNAGELVRQLHANLQRHYNRTNEDLLKAWKGDKGISAEKVRQLLALNDDTIARLEMLEALETAIATLPAAHAELASANPDAASAALQALAAATERLNLLVGSRKGAKKRG